MSWLIRYFIQHRFRALKRQICNLTRIISLRFKTRFHSKMDEEGFTPAIPIDLTQDNDFDLDVPPMTGNEYLRRVRNEAMEIPAVVVAKRNFSKLNEKQNIHVLQNDGCLPAPEGLEPSPGWKQGQISHFARLRQEFIEYKTTHEIEMKEAKSKLPCVEQVLAYHVERFKNTGLSYRQGQWFYALLVSLQKPLTPEACSSIRTLARRCSYLRGLLQNDSDTQLVPLNLLICLVCKYFEQKDLGG